MIRKLPWLAKNKKLTIWLLGGLLLLILLFFSSYWWHQTHFWFGWLEADDYQPALVSQIAGDFNGEVIFNDEVKTMVFSDQIIQAIDEAQTDIKVAMFALTSPDLVAALLRAREKGSDS
jgi:phosphatidylserine/phosphatidylglycerophosphate/cardiolipin synthase-like enzyme